MTPASLCQKWRDEQTTPFEEMTKFEIVLLHQTIRTNIFLDFEDKNALNKTYKKELYELWFWDNVLWNKLKNKPKIKIDMLKAFKPQYRTIILC